MCAQFLIKTRIEDLRKKFGIVVPDNFELDTIDLLVTPHNSAPVIRLDAKHLTLSMMNFSLIPAWSKEKRPKFATHNARLETVAEKPTWKRPFVSRRVLVPLTRFIEPIYLNEFAGYMVQFHEKSDRLLLAAGISDEWTDKESGEVIESFAIITGDPPKFVEKTGHDRCPLFLKEGAFEAWLDPNNKDPKMLLDLLQKNTADLDLAVEKFRPMRPGWEKRIPK